MIGLVYAGKPNRLEWKEMEAPTIESPFGARIRIDAVSPCTTDVHQIQTDFIRLPYMREHKRPFGHEAVGTVIEVGSEVKDFKIGDRVAISACQPNFRTLEAQSGIAKARDNSYFTMDSPKRTGVFVEEFCIPDADMSLAHIPDNVTWEQALMVTDMMCTSFAGVRELGMQFGDSVAVIGIGPVGLMAVRAAVLHGAGRVFAVGSREICFDVAKEYGATDCVNYRDSDYIEKIIEANGGRQVDRVIVAGGSFETIADGLRLTRFGGSCVNLVSFAHERGSSLPVSCFSHEKNLKSVMADGGRYAMEHLMNLISNGRVAPEKIITHVYHGKKYLTDAIDLFMNLDRSLIKPVVYFDD